MGRVDCLLGRNICFKKYIKGSYFGDIEFVGGMRRLFSVRAETATTLIAIPVDALKEVYKMYPQCQLQQWRNTLMRYLYYKEAHKRASFFSKITYNDEWWEKENDFDDVLRGKFVRWFDRIAEIHNDWKRFNQAGINR